MRRLEPLDGVRGIAVALVMLQHFESLVLAPLPPQLRTAAHVVCQDGWLGVEMFFVLSGYLITSILLRSKDDRRYWRTFYLKRFFRLVPLFACLIVPLVLVVGWKHEMPWWQAFGLLTPMANWFMLRHEPPYLGHLWSLAVEEQFYLLWPFVVRFCRPRTAAVVAVWVAIVSLAALCIGSRLPLSAVVLYKGTITHLFGIALGCAVAVALTRSPSRWVSPGAATAAMWGGLLLFCAGLAVARVHFHLLSLFWLRPALVAIGILAASVATAGVIVATARGSLSSSLRFVLEMRWLRWLGLRSYAIYLIHYVLANWYYFHGSRWSPGLTFAVLLTVTCLLAEASWRLIERPSLQAGARLTHRPESMLNA